MAMYSIYSGVDQLGIVGNKTAGIFAQEGRTSTAKYFLRTQLAPLPQSASRSPPKGFSVIPVVG